MHRFLCKITQISRANDFAEDAVMHLEHIFCHFPEFYILCDDDSKNQTEHKESGCM